MDFTFSNLQFNRIILHNVFPPNDGCIVDPKTSNHLTVLDSVGKLKLQERITKVLGIGSSCIQMKIAQDGDDSCFKKACELIDSDEASYIKESKEIANMHTKVHTNSKWPGGTLVIIDGTVGYNNCRTLIIIKAEIQEGFRETVNQHSVLMEFIDNLLLTPQQKLYKIGTFIEVSKTTSANGNRNKDDFLAFVFDSNITTKDYRKAAQYFYSNFLGLKFPENAEQMTSDFYEFTCNYINSAPITPQRKLELRSALTTYLRVDQSQTIEINRFAELYLDQDDHDGYESYMINRGFPSTAVSKDINLIKKKLNIRNMVFTSSVKISAPAEGFGNLINIVEQTDEHTLLKVKGKLATQTS